MVVGSKHGDGQYAVKDKYETAEQAMQKKWQKYCARGDFLLTTLCVIFLRCSCFVQTAILDTFFEFVRVRLLSRGYQEIFWHLFNNVFPHARSFKIKLSIMSRHLSIFNLFLCRWFVRCSFVQVL